MQAFITINGHPYPQPFRGTTGEVELQAATIVDSARNANGVVVGQKVGRDIQKINQLRWAHLKAEVWAAILQEFDTHFFSTVTYPDMVHNTWTTRTMYCSDRSAKPFRLDPNTGLPSEYVDCRVNVIDVGS